jgi:hypothetical protein
VTDQSLFDIGFERFKVGNTSWLFHNFLHRMAVERTFTNIKRLNLPDATKAARTASWSLPLLSFRPNWLTEWKRAYAWTLDPTFRFLCLDWSSSIANFAAPHHRRQLGDAWRRSAVVGSSIFCTVAQMS